MVRGVRVTRGLLLPPTIYSRHQRPYGRPGIYAYAQGVCRRFLIGGGVNPERANCTAHIYTVRRNLARSAISCGMSCTYDVSGMIAVRRLKKG